MRRPLLVLAVSAIPVLLSAQCSELFFSEYCEGSSQNKALENYNPTQNPIDLSDYAIKRYANGSMSASETLVLSGTLAASDVVVVVNGQLDSAGGFGAVDPVLYAIGDIASPGNHDIDPMYFNGDDGIALERVSTGITVDIIGEIGVDPGVSWTDDATANYTDANGGAYWTANHTLVRKHTVMGGLFDNPSPFNVTLEWDSLPSNTWSGLGHHICDCPTVDAITENTAHLMAFAPNPAENGQVLIKANARITAVQVYDSRGRSIYGVTPSDKSGTYLLNIPDAVSGLYMVQVALENGARLSLPAAGALT